MPPYLEPGGEPRDSDEESDKSRDHGVDVEAEVRGAHFTRQLAGSAASGRGADGRAAQRGSGQGEGGRTRRGGSGWRVRGEYDTTVTSHSSQAYKSAGGPPPSREESC